MKSGKRFHKRQVDFVPELPKCRGKIIHLSHRSAEKSRQEILSVKPQYLRIYKCPWCHRFHLTSQKQTRK